MVVFEELVSDCRLVEQRVHARLEGYRTNPKWEFFRIEVKVAIKTLQREARHFLVSTENADRFDVLSELRRRFGNWLKPDIRELAIVNVGDLCIVETMRQPHVAPGDRVIEQPDLGVIGGYSPDPDQTHFRPEDSIAENAHKLVELDDPAYFYCIPIFTNEAYSKAQDLNNAGFDTLDCPRGI